jgi:SpoVK/Ycf46/Vps4 family AAA+-type ATPase
MGSNEYNGNFTFLVENDPKFGTLKTRLGVAVRLSLPGITNLVVNYEDSSLVNDFLLFSFKKMELYNETIETDAVELQQGSPGNGHATTYLDRMIFGSFKTTEDKELGVNTIFDIDPQTGKRMREPDGFVNRSSVKRGVAKDKLLIIRNIDQSLDFCRTEIGVIDLRSLWIFDNFRNPKVRQGCRLLLVTNKRLKFPFKVGVVEFERVQTSSGNHIIDGFKDLYSGSGYAIDFNDSQRQQIIRKICGLTYTEAASAVSESISNSLAGGDKKEIDSFKAIKLLREKINRNFMEDAQGLSHLTSRPWEDYICPESSNFTYDVAKILRDFEEIKSLKEQRKEEVLNNDKSAATLRSIDAIQSRMPHVIILYGKGGVGKSAFPIHFAGLLDFDVWDFNISACHSKWVGEGSERMREALKKISLTSHVVIRIDEYDRAIGSGAASGQGMHSAHKQVESEFMNWLQNAQEDNLFVKNNIFVVLTTNHKDNITGPLLRSGRADLVIDIDNFDVKSMKETFLSAPRRMENRGVNVTGFKTQDEFLQAVEKLDLDKLANLASLKNFTVRDVDTLLKEMSAHHYYFLKGKKGAEWTTDNFAKVLENSVGSAKDDDTCELVLGDRYLFEEDQPKQQEESQLAFPFLSSPFDVEKIKKQSFTE